MSKSAVEATEYGARLQEISEDNATFHILIPLGEQV